MIAEAIASRKEKCQKVALQIEILENRLITTYNHSISYNWWFIERKIIISVPRWSSPLIFFVEPDNLAITRTCNTTQLWISIIEMCCTLTGGVITISISISIWWGRWWRFTPILWAVNKRSWGRATFRAVNERRIPILRTWTVNEWSFSILCLRLWLSVSLPSELVRLRRFPISIGLLVLIF